VPSARAPMSITCVAPSVGEPTRRSCSTTRHVPIGSTNSQPDASDNANRLRNLLDGHRDCPATFRDQVETIRVGMSQ